MQEKFNEKKSLVVSLFNRGRGYDTLTNTITTVDNQAYSQFQLDNESSNQNDDTGKLTVTFFCVLSLLFILNLI